MTTGTLQARGKTGGYDPGCDGAAANLLVAMTLNAKGGSGRIDGESETFVTHSLTTRSAVEEDGTGRGIPLVPVGFTIHGTDKTISVASETSVAGSLRTKPPGSIENSSSTVVLLFSCKDHSADVGETAPTLRSMGFDKSHANAGGQVAVAFGISNQPTPKFGSDVMPTLNGHYSGGRNDAVAFNLRGREDPCHPLASGAHPPAIAGTAVRRLTPEECESLQGFQRGYTNVPYRGKPAADGPRYAAIGNSMAAPVMRWIGERIDAIEARGLAHQKSA